MGLHINPFCALCGLPKTPNKSGRMMCKPCVDARLARIKPPKPSLTNCEKCGMCRVRGASGRAYCKACKLRAAGWHSASVAAWQNGTRVREMSALDMFDALVLHITDVKPRLDSVRLKAGESLYSRKAM